MIEPINSVIEPINSDNPDNAADGADGTTKMYKGVHFVLLFFSIAFLFMRMFDVDEDLSQPFFFILLGTLWAALEVQIEGEHGWAENFEREWDMLTNTMAMSVEDVGERKIVVHEREYVVADLALEADDLELE